MKNDVKEELIDRFDKDIQQIKIDSKDRVAENENPIEKVIVYLAEKRKMIPFQSLNQLILALVKKSRKKGWEVEKMKAYYLCYPNAGE